jgi:hypothetical protein
MKAGGKQSYYSGSFLGLIFDPEDGGDMFLRNVMTLHYHPCENLKSAWTLSSNLLKEDNVSGPVSASVLR